MGKIFIGEIIDKKEVLKIVKKMLLDWELGYKKLSENYLDNDPAIIKGFCNYMFIKSNSSTIVLDELRKDLIRENKDNLSKDFSSLFKNWYSTQYEYYKCSVEKQKEALKYRIDHLKRTISRLEQELQN